MIHPRLRTLAIIATLCLTLPVLAQRQTPADTEHVKHFRVKSKLLSAFWGRDMFLEAGVVLPPPGKGVPPVCINVHGFGGSHRGAWRRGDRLVAKMKGGDYPPMLYVYPNAQFSLGHHEFADSVNNGPWGEAFVTEFLPALEKTFACGGSPSARFLTGHSSGGWSSLWLMVKHPDLFAGTWSTAPDSVDFRDFTGINVYQDGNAYTDEGGQEKQLIRRNGEWAMSIKQFVSRELARREYGGQFASFDAVFSPRGDDSRPMPLFDRKTGKIDPFVAKSWERYDIRLILKRNWKTLGPKLKGKINLYMGMQDTFRLEGAAKLLKQDLAALGSDAEILLVPGRDHGSLFQPHPEFWPKGMIEHIHRAMWARFQATKAIKR